MQPDPTTFLLTRLDEDAATLDLGDDARNGIDSTAGSDVLAWTIPTLRHGGPETRLGLAG